MTLPQICVTLRGHSIEEMIRDAGRATAAGANLVEVRFDNLYVTRIEVDPIVSTNSKGDEVIEKQPPIIENKDFDQVDIESSIEALKDGIKIPVIFTCRSKDDSGYFHASESKRVTVLAAAVKSEVSWVDLEISMKPKQRKELVDACGTETQIIASSHLPAPSSVDEICEHVNAHTADGAIVKCCYVDVTHASSLSVFEAASELNDSEVSAALMGLGPGGDWTRLHAPLLGQPLVFTTLERDYSLFQRGLVNINDLKTAWRLLEYE
jgi:3-dehydroquinate dehydratase type I